MTERPNGDGAASPLLSLQGGATYESSSSTDLLAGYCNIYRLHVCRRTLGARGCESGFHFPRARIGGCLASSTGRSGFWAAGMARTMIRSCPLSRRTMGRGAQRLRSIGMGTSSDCALMRISKPHPRFKPKRTAGIWPKYDERGGAVELSKESTKYSRWEFIRAGGERGQEVEHYYIRNINDLGKDAWLSMNSSGTRFRWHKEVRGRGSR